MSKLSGISRAVKGIKKFKSKLKRSSKMPPGLNHEEHEEEKEEYSKKDMPDAPKDKFSCSIQSADELAPTVNFKTIALYDYDAIDDGDLSFRKDDVLKIIQRITPHWFFAEDSNHKVGYVPANYVRVLDKYLLKFPGYMNVLREEAVRILMHENNGPGTFILRPLPESQTGFQICTLSVKSASEIPDVKHYQVFFDHQEGFYLNKQFLFKTMNELLDSYKENSAASASICCPLTAPCPDNYRPPIPFRELKRRKEEFQMIECVGQGHFGEVWLANWTKSSITRKVAIKQLFPKHCDKKNFLNEATKLHFLRHPRIVELLGICMEDDAFYIITEFMENGSLLSYLRDKKNWPAIYELRVIEILAEIACGMSFLEEKKIVHRDLRAANILIGTNFSVKVADFGLARLLKNDGVLENEKELIVPYRWTSPEALFQGTFFCKSDVWSFGVLMYEVVTFGRVPYQRIKYNELMNKLQCNYRLPNPDQDEPHIHCPQQLYEIMLTCWDENPEKRPLFIELYFNFVHWIAEY